MHAHSDSIVRRRAMTLVEVLAVVIILSLIAGTLLISFSGSVGEAKHELAKTGIGSIAAQLEKYHMKHGSFPTNDVGLQALTDGHAQPTASYYLSPGQLSDPWKKPYLYVNPGPDGHPYEILSYGADGQRGGDGENADISSINLKAD